MLGVESRVVGLVVTGGSQCSRIQGGSKVQAFHVVLIVGQLLELIRRRAAKVLVAEGCTFGEHLLLVAHLDVTERRCT